jgi:hypothetical protein
MKRKHITLAALTMALGLIAAAPAAGALAATPTSSVTADGVAVSSQGLESASNYTLTVTKGGTTTTTQSLDDGTESVTTSNDSSAASTTRIVQGATPAVTAAPAAAAATAYLYCNKLYLFTKPTNQFSIQHSCGATTSPWGISIDKGLCAVATSDAKEVGMNWTRNGTKQGRQSDHTETCTYHFHGTFNPDKNSDRLTYSDTFTFDVEGDGHATLTVYGDITTSGSKCGSATSC